MKIRDNCNNVWLYFKLAKKIIIKLTKFIAKLDKLFAEFLLILYFILKYTKTSWCKCLLSGFSGDRFKLNFLKIENKFSKQGYHNKSAIKKGDMLLSLL